MQESAHLLIVDDDREIRDLLTRFLQKHGFRVTAAADGREMMHAFDGGRFDLVVLDLMMPGEDGLSLCQKVRARSPVPVIMLTAMGEETDRIVGLEVGADDYVTKPFNPRELLARIKAVLRRTQTASPAAAEGGRFHFADWILDVPQRSLSSADGDEADLTSGEFDLLQVMVERPNRVLSRDQLLDLTKGRAATPFDRSIDVLLSRLRRKIEPDPKVPRLLKTVRGGGYMLSATVEKS